MPDCWPNRETDELDKTTNIIRQRTALTLGEIILLRRGKSSMATLQPVNDVLRECGRHCEKACIISSCAVLCKYA